MKVFYANYKVESSKLETGMIMEAQDNAADFADRVRKVGVVINITETFYKNSFRVTVWYLAPYKVEIL